MITENGERYTIPCIAHSQISWTKDSGGLLEK